MKLKDKVAIVTGAGGAICGEIAVALAREGVSVAIWDISIDLASKKAEEIRASDGRAVSIECDATDRENVTTATNVVLTEYGTIDILVNGAGGSHKESTTSPYDVKDIIMIFKI